MLSRLHFLLHPSPSDAKKALGVIVLSACLTFAFSANFGLFLDTQHISSTQWRLYFKYPLLSPLERGDLINFTAHEQVFFGKGEGSQVAKYIVGVPGDKIESVSGHVYLNGVETAELNPDFFRVFNHNPKEFEKKYQLNDGEYFVLGTSERSFDSRYWGPIKRSWINARLIGII